MYDLRVKDDPLSGYLTIQFAHHRIPIFLSFPSSAIIKSVPGRSIIHAAYKSGIILLWCPFTTSRVGEDRGDDLKIHSRAVAIARGFSRRNSRDPDAAPRLFGAIGLDDTGVRVDGGGTIDLVKHMSSSPPRVTLGDWSPI